ncbi:MAG: transketolase [Calditrichaeota bacterium]|nr:transketolase [Calditrichota bacterium]
MEMNDLNEGLLQLTANTIRFLAVDAIQKANSGHPGLPMGAADYAAVLWMRYLNFNPEDPHWPNRDRFVLSAGHGSMLLYALLHLAGFDLTLEDLKQFRQLHSRTPGHPEYGLTPGVETTTGPLGQGFGNGVGMAIAAKMMAARFNTPDFSPVTHRVFGIVSDGDLMEGVSSEAASLAGHLKLGHLIYIYDDNHITIEGKTSLTFSEDVGKRFEAYGWHIQKIDGHNVREIDQALQQAILFEDAPSLIIAKTHIGFGSPNKQDTSAVHGSPLGEEEVRLTKEHFGWPLEPTFYVPEDVRMVFKNRRFELKSHYENWQAGFQDWQQAHPDQARQWEAYFKKAVPEKLAEQLVESVKGTEGATRALSGKVLQKAAELLPNLVGGSADLEPSTKTGIKNAGDIEPGTFSGRNFHFGIREHGMGSILNGLSLYGSWIPFGSTFLVFSDYMRPTIRLSALMGIQVIYVFTHDSIFVGEDGPTHQPVEHIAALRVIPNLQVVRPADAEETALTWAFALQRQDGPTALILTRQGVPAISRTQPVTFDQFSKGGYIVSDAVNGTPDLVLVATGSELHLAVEAKTRLENEGLKIRVVSMPADRQFLQQPRDYQESVLGEPQTKRVVIEAGVSAIWPEIVGKSALMVGINRFGASAPAKDLANYFGLTAEAVTEKIRTWLG